MESMIKSIMLEKQQDAIEILASDNESLPEPQISGYSTWYLPPDEQELGNISKTIAECQDSSGPAIKKSGSMSGFKSWIDFSDSISVKSEEGINDSDSSPVSLDDGSKNKISKSSKKKKIKKFFTRAMSNPMGKLGKTYSPQTSIDGLDDEYSQQSSMDGMYIDKTDSPQTARRESQDVHVLEDEQILDSDAAINDNQLPYSEEIILDSHCGYNVKAESGSDVILPETDESNINDIDIDENNKEIQFPDWSIFPNETQCHRVLANDINKHGVLTKSNSDPKSAIENSESAKKKKPSKKYHTIDSDSLESALASEKSFLSSHVNTFPGSLRDFLTPDSTKQDPLADLVKSHVTHVSCYGPEKYKIDPDSGDSSESLVQQNAVWYIDMQPWEILFFSQEYDNVAEIENCKDVIIHEPPPLIP